MSAKLRREYFWVDVVQKAFNDVYNNLVLPELIIVISDMSADLCRPCFRSGKKMKELFHKLRSEFSDPLDRWNRSGQGDPDQFPMFLNTALRDLSAKSNIFNFLSLCADAAHRL